MVLYTDGIYKMHRVYARCIINYYRHMEKDSPFYVVGNWKSNKTVDEVVLWWQDFSFLWKKSPINSQKVKIILCPSFIHLTTLKSLIELSEIPVELGVQDLSPFAKGPYTAEVSASMLVNLVKYSIIGHSERRKYFSEKHGELVAEIEQAILAKIDPIYCIQKPSMVIPHGVKLVGYEPVWAIGTGRPETPENASKAASVIKSNAKQNVGVIYGGSVNADNVASYVTQDNIIGVLPGGASLDPRKFFSLLKNAENAQT